MPDVNSDTKNAINQGNQGFAEERYRESAGGGLGYLVLLIILYDRMMFIMNIMLVD